MTKDLEETLNELGPEYRSVVDRLVAAYEPLPQAERPSSRGRVLGWTVGYLVAASLLVCLGVSALLRPSASRVRPGDAHIVYTVAYAADGEALRAIVATQRADGSWANDFLTRQNAAALRSVPDASAAVAYKKAARYLRAKGLQPLSDAELRARGDFAARVSWEGRPPVEG